MSDNISKFQKNAELIFTYIYNNRMIIISAAVLIIVIVAGILIYNMNIENQDKTINAEFESAFALYSQIPQERLSEPNVIIEMTTRFQKVYRSERKNFEIESGLFFRFDLLRYRKF